MSDFALKKLENGERDRIVSQAIEALRRRGPDRIVIDEEGTAVPPTSKIVPRHWSGPVCDSPIDLVFVRDDGWTLGVRHAYVGVAHRMFTGQWIAIFEWRQVEEWRKPPAPCVPVRVDEPERDAPIRGTIDEIRKAFKA